MSQPFLITGMIRSGTTLLDKLIGAHLSAMAISQPIPMLYRTIKTEFFKQNGISTNKYVLNDLFDEKRYSRGDLLSFLKEFKIAPLTLNEILMSMKGWSGQYTELNKDALLDNYTPQTLSEFYTHLLKIYASNNKYQAIGTKEVLIEEFIEYFLNNGVKVIVVIRDPRDVITSLNIGKGTQYSGQHRPTLFHIRNWRKSVAVANTFNNHNGLMVLKYENLVQHQTETLRKITDFLELDPFKSNHFDYGIKRSDGGYWEGNSSTENHKGINQNNAGKYKKHLDFNTISFIEYMCAPELKMLGYEFDNDLDEPKSFNEPFDIGECELDINMSRSIVELDKERSRRNLFYESTIPVSEILANFYSERNFQQLKKQFK